VPWRCLGTCSVFTESIGHYEGAYLAHALPRSPLRLFVLSFCKAHERTAFNGLTRRSTLNGTNPEVLANIIRKLFLDP
jgi:hypothetical protein